MTFLPDEWAVLTHDSGGRLFQVGSVEPRREDGSYRVTEKPLPHSMEFQVWNSNLVKVESKEAGAQLVAVLDFIYEEHRSQVRDLKATAVARAKRAVGRFAVWNGDEA